MKNLKLFATLGLFLTFMGSTGIISAEGTVWCGWDYDLQACHAGGHHGYCAYGGADCTTTIPTVNP